MEDPSSYLRIWPESAALASALQVANRQQHIAPAVVFAEPLVDIVAEIIARLGTGVNVQRPVVESSIDGLKFLIKCGNLRAALNLSTKLLTDLGQGKNKTGSSKNSLLTFEIWAIRFQIFMALRMYSALNEELEPFKELDSPDTFLQYYSEYSEFKGSIVPYSARLVHAEAPSFRDVASERWLALTRAQRLANNTKATLELAQNSSTIWASAAVGAWQKRLESVELMRVRLFYRLKRYNSAFSACEQILNGQSDDTEKRRELLASLIRMSISVGSSTRLIDYFERFGKSNASHEQRVIHEALKAIFYGNYVLAETTLQALGPSSLLSRNNGAIALFYNGRVEASLDALLKHDGALLEPIAINAMTIADLTTTSSGALMRAYLLEHSDANLSDVFNARVVIKD